MASEEGTQPPGKVLESLCVDLRRERSRRREYLWQFTNEWNPRSSYEQERSGPDLDTKFCSVLWSEVDRARRTLQEKYEVPIKQLRACLDEITSVLNTYLHRRDYASLFDISGIFLRYRLTAQDLVHADKKHWVFRENNGRSTICHCAIAEEGNAFVVADSLEHPMLLTWNHWFVDHDSRKWLVDSFAHKISAYGPDALCFLGKHSGSVGPIQIREDLLKSWNVDHFFVDESRNNTIEQPPGRPPRRLLLLYDLLGSRRVISFVQQHLKMLFPDADIASLVLFDYGRPRRETAEERENGMRVMNVLDSRFNDAESTLDLIRRRGTESSLEGKTAESTPPKDAEATWCAKKSSSFLRGRSYLMNHYPRLSEEFRGKWVAVNGSGLIAHSKTRETLSIAGLRTEDLYIKFLPGILPASD